MRQTVGLCASVQGAFKCSIETAEAIARSAAERAHPQGAVIIRQGDAAGETFLMMVGRARATAFGRGGEEVVLLELLPGDLFGALLAEADPASAAEIVAVDASRSAVFPAREFLALAERHGCIGLALSRMLLRQLRAASERLVERATLTAVGRIHASLLRLAVRRDGRMLAPALVHSELARQLQTTRETVSRAVNALERRGIVRREGQDLVIVAPQRLEELIV